MAVRQYVGARYVPKFAEPIAWQEGTSYEAMTIVLYNNSSYTSKVPVPATVGTPANNSDYWALTGNYNAQVEQYRQDVEKAVEKVEDIEDHVQDTSDKFDARVETALGDIGDKQKDAEDAIAEDKQDALDAIDKAIEPITTGLATEKAERVAADTQLEGEITNANAVAQANGEAIAELTKTLSNLPSTEQIATRNSDSYNNYVTVSKVITINKPDGFSQQGFCIVDGVGYTCVTQSNGKDRIYRYPSILTNAEYDKYIEVDTEHLSCICARNGYLYAIDAFTGSIVTVRISDMAIVEQKIPTYTMRSLAFVDYGNTDNVLLVGEDTYNEVLDAEIVTFGDDGKMSVPSDMDLRQGSLFPIHRSYDQGICSLPNHHVMMLRSSDRAENKYSYMALIDPKQSAAPAVFVIPYTGEFEGICLYNNNLYIIEQSGGIYNAGVYTKYEKYAQYPERSSDLIKNRTTNCEFIYHQHFDSLPCTITASGDANIIRPFSYYTMLKVSVTLNYASHTSVTCAGYVIPREVTYLPAVASRDAHDITFILTCNASSNIIISYQGGSVNGTHYPTVASLPSDEQPNSVDVYISL